MDKQPCEEFEVVPTTDAAVGERFEVFAGSGPCMICNCRGYKGISGQWCERCGHSPRDHS